MTSNPAAWRIWVSRRSTMPWPELAGASSATPGRGHASEGPSSDPAPLIAATLARHAYAIAPRTKPSIV